MDLKHPDEVRSDEMAGKHPFSADRVETAFQMAEPDMTLAALHNKLTTVQKALEKELERRPCIYDPMKLCGKHIHKIEEYDVPEPYSGRLYLEDKYNTFKSEEAQKLAIAHSKARNELSDEINVDDLDKTGHDKVHKRQKEIADNINLDNYTENEIMGHANKVYNIWEQVAEVLSVDRDGSILRAVKITHELCYTDVIFAESEYKTSGFVIGIPEMFLSGMRAEQRMFSSLAGLKMPPAQIVDVYGNRTSYKQAIKWATKRGVSASTVSQNRKKGSREISEKWNEDTYPENLTDGW